MGVWILPWAVSIVPALAPDFASLFLSVNFIGGKNSLLNQESNDLSGLFLKFGDLRFTEFQLYSRLMLLTVFYTLTGLHLIHLLRLSVPVLKHKNTPGPIRPPFSIIIAARNELRNLKELIPAILDQEYPKYEVIVALDRCSDNSHQYLASISAQVPYLHYLDIQKVPEGINGKKHALTQAIKQAKYEWILLTDADCRPGSTLWIDSFAQAIDEHSAILIGISPYETADTLLNHFIQYETTYTGIKYVKASLTKKPFMAVGRNLAYQKSLFLSGNGFSPYEGMVGGDDDLFIQKYANRENTRVVIGKNGITYSKPEKNLLDYLRQKTRHLHIGKLYKQKNVHIYWALTHGILWLCFIYLILAQPINIGVISTFILLILIKGVIFNLSSRKMGYNYNPLLLPISDLIYGVLYPFVGIRALLLRKVKWK